MKMELLYPENEIFRSDFARPIFLSSLNSIDDLGMSSRWLCRDGLVGLLWFFLQNPLPPRQFTRLYIHHALAPIAPPSWRPHCGQYSVRSTRHAEPATRPTEHALHVEFVYPPYNSPESSLLSKLRDRRESKNWFVLVPAPFISPTDCARFYQQLNALSLEGRAATNRFLSFDEFSLIESLTDHSLVDWNNRTLIADSFLAHLALAKGAHTDSPSGLGDFRALSHFHGYEFHERIDTSAPSIFPSQEICSLYRDILGENPVPPGNWPLWVDQLGRDLGDSETLRETAHLPTTPWT